MGTVLLRLLLSTVNWRDEYERQEEGETEEGAMALSRVKGRKEIMVKKWLYCYTFTLAACQI